MNTKTIFKMLAAAMLMPAMLLTTACSSDDDAVNDNANTQKKYYEIPVTVTVTRQGDEGTRAVYNETDKTLSFSEGDKLFVNGNHPTTGAFAGVLELVSATDGTFEGTVLAEYSNTGTAKAFLEQVGNHAFATLLPAGYENYEYLQYTESNNPEEGITSPYTNLSAVIENSLLPLGKAEAVAQLSYEHAFDYNNSVFALSPVQPVICCTISGLPANTDVPVFYDGEFFDISGDITTDASGTATFAFADLAERTLGTLTVNGNDITLPSNFQLEAGKVYNINRSVAPAPAYTLLSAATTADYGKVVCAAGHLHPAKTAVPAGCTAVGILGKVTETGHGLILALQGAANQTWNTINGWTSETTYAGTTLKVLPDGTRGSLTSYTALGETTVSNWAVAQKSDYEAIFINLGSTTGDKDGKTFDGNVNAYITGAGGTALTGNNQLYHWCATTSGGYGVCFNNQYWFDAPYNTSYYVRPVLGF